MAKKIEEDFRQMNEQLDALYGQQPQTDIDFRRADLQMKVLGAKSSLVKLQIEYLKMLNDEQRLVMESQRLSLDQLMAKFRIAADVSRAGGRARKDVENVMLNIFPEEDKQVLAIMKAAGRLESIAAKPQ